jgi:hypothetical protein
MGSPRMQFAQTDIDNDGGVGRGVVRWLYRSM